MRMGTWSRDDGLSAIFRLEMQSLCRAVSGGVVGMRMDDWILQIHLGTERHVQILVDLESWVDSDRNPDDDYSWIFLGDPDGLSKTTEEEILTSIQNVAADYSQNGPVCKIVHDILSICSRVLRIQDEPSVVSALTLLKDEIGFVTRKRMRLSPSEEDEEERQQNRDIFVSTMDREIKELKSAYPYVETHVSMPLASTLHHRAENALSSCILILCTAVLHISLQLFPSIGMVQLSMNLQDIGDPQARVRPRPARTRTHHRTAPSDQRAQR